MAPMNLFEKLGKMTSSMNGTTIFMIFVLVLLIAAIFLFADKNKKYSYLSYGCILVLVGFVFKNSLFPLIDMFIERLFYLFYFPTGAIYMITLVVSHVIFLTTLGNKKQEKSTRNINYIGFALMQVLCVNVLSYLSTSKIDLTNELNFVDDATMLGILELSMLVFTMWMGVLMVSTIIRKLTRTVLVNEEQPVVVEESPVYTHTSVLQPALASLAEKWKEVKEHRPTPVQPQAIPTAQFIEQPIEEPKMNQDLLNRLLQPEPMVVNQIEEELKTTTVSTVKEPVLSWSNAVVEALHIPNDPIYDDVEEAFINRLEETVPTQVETVQEVAETPKANVTTAENKEESNKVVDLCERLLRKQEDPGHSLEDYLELKKYLVAQK